MIHWKRPWSWESLKAGEGMTDDEMFGWHPWLDGREFEQVLGVADGQGRLACYSPWGCKEWDMTEWLNCCKCILFHISYFPPFIQICLWKHHWLLDLLCLTSLGWTSPRKLDLMPGGIFNFCWLFQRVSVIRIRPHLTNREVLRKRLGQFHHPETSLLLECSSE